jgi:putative membrane protein
MQTHGFGHFVLAAAFCTACGGGSGSTDTQTLPVAAVEPESEPAATPPAQVGTGSTGTAGTTGVGAGTMGTGTQGTGQTGSTDASGAGERQPVSGTDVGSTDAPLGQDQTETAAAPLGEPQIVALLSAANEHEIAVSKLAIEKSKNSKVKSFARTMVKDHGKMLADGKAAAKKLDITPEENEDARTLRSESDMALEKLRGLEGGEFDRAFADQMVTDHQKVIDLLENKIGPAATSNPTLDKLVTAAKPKIQMHLEHAQTLRDQVEEK